MDIDQIIEGGMTFRPARAGSSDNGKVKTKAKKKAYITGSHGSGSASQIPAAACQQKKKIRTINGKIKMF